MPRIGADGVNVTTRTLQETRTLTVKGAPMTQAQQSLATAMLGTAGDCNASTLVMVALMCAAICENTLSASYESDVARIGPLSPDAGTARYGSAPAANSAQVANQVTDFCRGGGGGAFSSAIELATQFTDPVALAAHAERCPTSSGYGPDGYGQYAAFDTGQITREATAIVSAYGGGELTSGGVAGVGSSTGTSSDAPSSSGYQMGSTDNPDQDFWTTINQLAQERQWYLFSDSETIYLADGPDLLQQTPALVLDRWADNARIQSLAFCWDNTAFQYTVNRKKPSKRVVRKSTLTKVQSPTQATLDVICDIDEVRAGDIVLLSGCGPGDGKWLVGDCTRSVFEVYSELTLVPPMAPLSEQEAAGTGLGSGSSKSSSSASAPGAGTCMAAMLAAAQAISAARYPYVHGGGHGKIGVPSGGPPAGYDCSGSVSAVLGAGGLLKLPQSTFSMRQALGSSVVQGEGSGNPECTIFLNAATHVFMRLNGQYFGTSIGDDGSGPGRLNGTTADGGSGGPTLYKRGTVAPDVGAAGFVAYHVPQNLLGLQVGSSS